MTDCTNIHLFLVYIVHLILMHIYDKLSKKGGDILIKYKIDIIQTLKSSGYSTYKIRKEKLFTESQLQNIRDNKLLTQEALNKLCHFLNCQPGDLLEYIPDPGEEP